MWGLLLLMDLMVNGHQDWVLELVFDAVYPNSDLEWCDKLTKLYQSLIPALGHTSYTWLIKDNGSKDNTVETVKGGKKIKYQSYSL